MKIEFGSITLADSPATIPMTNLRVNGTNIVQEIALYAATAEAVADRGNEKTEVSFDTTRLFSSAAAAEDFILKHKANLRGNATLKFTESDGSTIMNLLNAAVVSVQSAISGFTTKHSYRITGPAITAP